MKLLVLSLLVCAALAKEVCVNSWSSYNGRHFTFVDTQMTWADAQEHCVRLGGSLASIHNQAEDGFVKKLSFEQSAWIGLTDAHEEAKWLYVNSYSVDYVNWCSGQPNNTKASQNCVNLSYTGKKCWDDEDCPRKLPFVCVRE